MFTFRKAKTLMTMRPEGTAGVARALISHNMAERGIQQLYYAGPMFR